MNTVPQNIKERKAGTDVRKAGNAPAAHKTSKPAGVSARKTNNVSSTYKTNDAASTHKKNDAVITHKSTESSQSNSINKQLKRMSRSELVEVIYALEKDLETLRAENEQLHAELNDKYIRLNNAGSLAEAALSLNHIFEDAQAAADQYLYSLKKAAVGAVNSTSAAAVNTSTSAVNTSVAAVNTPAATVSTARAATSATTAHTAATKANTSTSATTANTSAASVAQRGRYAQ